MSAFGGIYSSVIKVSVMDILIQGLLSDREVCKIIIITVKHARRHGNCLVCSNGDPRLTPTHLTAMLNFVT